MKTKISVSIDEETLEDIKKELRKGLFRNQSHMIEYSVRKVLGEKDE
ncbi:MAG: hypothetical protein ACE5DM_04560 [Candidatus Nanoarchaeia archaeon]